MQTYVFSISKFLNQFKVWREETLIGILGVINFQMKHTLNTVKNINRFLIVIFLY